MSNRIVLKEKNIKDLSVAYLEAGPQDGQMVFLFHGFPDSATSYSEIMCRLADQGYHSIAPFLRGFAPTKEVGNKHPKIIDSVTLGDDSLKFFDSFDANDAIIVGQDWGSSVAEIVTIFRSDKIKKLIKMNWYGIYMMAESKKQQGFNYDQLRNSWYIWMLNTNMGDLITKFDPIGFSKALWKQWTPQWDDKQNELFNQAQSSFKSPDFGKTVLSSYRNGMSDNSEIDQDFIHKQLALLPTIKTDTIVLSGAKDPVDSGKMSEETRKKYFTGKFEHRSIPDSGHFIHHQYPEEVIKAITN